MKIAWLADVQAPYREPMWTALADRSDLEVSFMFRDEKVRHWQWREHAGYASRIVDAWPIPVPGPVARRLYGRMAALPPGVVDRMLDGADVLVIHEWWQVANLQAAMRARRRGIPYLVYAESTMQSRRFSRGVPAWLRSAVFRNADAIVVPGSAARDAALVDGADPSRVVESINSVDMQVFRAAVTEHRADVDPDTEHAFVYVGQLIDRKNVDALLRAFTALDGRSTLHVAGDGVNMTALRAEAVERGVADRVTFHGFLAEPELAELLARGHTLVLPSTEEVFGFTAVEGHVAGLQVIVSDRAGVAPNLMHLPGVWVVDPAEASLRTALADARTQWSGWNTDVDVEFASPQRAAEEVLRAIAIARGDAHDRSVPARRTGTR